MHRGASITQGAQHHQPIDGVVIDHEDALSAQFYWIWRHLAMRRIEEEGGRMGVIVDDLLLLARLDQGRPLQREPVDLVTLAEDAVTDARATDPQRDISLAAPDDCVRIGLGREGFAEGHAALAATDLEGTIET